MTLDDPSPAATASTPLLLPEYRQGYVIDDNDESSTKRPQLSRPPTLNLIVPPSGSTSSSQVSSPSSFFLRSAQDERYSHGASGSPESRDTRHVHWKRSQRYSSLILWGSMLLLSTAISLAAQSVPQFQSYALGALDKDGLAWLGFLGGVQNSVITTARAPIARLADVYGQFEAFSFSVIIIVLGFTLSSLSGSIVTFGIGQCLLCIGQVGIQFLESIVAADNSSLSNRGLATALTMTPFAFTVFAVGPIAQALLPDHWRLGYAIWILIVPLTSIPLLLYLYTVRYTQPSLPEPETPKTLPSLITPPALMFDTRGLLLLVSSLVMILFSTTPSSSNHLVLKNLTLLTGAATMVFFIYHQIVLTPHPILALHLLRTRTVLFGCILTFLYFLAFSLYVPYLFTYLVIAQDLSISEATNAGLVYLFSSVIFGLLASLGMKLLKRFKGLAVLGANGRALGSLTMLLLTKPEVGVMATFSYQAFAGAGMGVGSWVVQVGVQAGVDPSDVGSVLALYATFGSLGGFLGDILSSSIFTSTILKNLSLLLPEDLKDQAEAIRSSILIATSYARGTEARTAIDASYIATMRQLHWWSLAVSVLAAIVVWGMKDLRLSDDNENDDDERDPINSPERESD